MSPASSKAKEIDCNDVQSMDSDASDPKNNDLLFGLDDEDEPMSDSDHIETSEGEDEE